MADTDSSNQSDVLMNLETVLSTANLGLTQTLQIMGWDIYILPNLDWYIAES